VVNFIIRDLTTYAEMLAVHKLQREIWGLDDPTFAIYPPLMNTAAKNGGVVLGAFDAQSGDIVAFLFGFLGRVGGGPFKLCSQAMGVRREWRQKGVAGALKAAQRQRVLAQGLPLITWTFDPLEGPNAHLNLHKLRAISRTYWRDVYGRDFGALNAGLPTDRLMVEWWVHGPRLDQVARPDIDSATPIFEVEADGVKRRIRGMQLDLQAESLQLEIVPDLQAMKSADIELALDWRLKVRAAFEASFARGFIATDFVTQVDPTTGERRNRYLLQRATPALLADIGTQE
jgi:predicted GNAT superfamily acetyltransferase